MSVRVVQVNAFQDPQARPAHELLHAWPTLLDVSAAVAAAGVDVHVVQAAHAAETVVARGVPLHFVTVGRSAPQSLAAAVAALSPDVVHLHGLAFPRHLLALRANLPAVPLIVQDHLDAVPRAADRPLWRRALHDVAAVAFTAVEQAEPFRQAGVLTERTRSFAIPESSSHFTPGDRTPARAALGITGDPVVLWVARLNRSKDPLTALRAFGRFAAGVPAARLYMVFTQAPLLRAVRAAIARDPVLRERVTLLGAQSRADVQGLMRAADVFLTASRREGSGYALLEAIATGTPIVASDIPPFRALLRGAPDCIQVRTGDVDGMAHALRSLTTHTQAPSRELRAHFERHLSFDALGTAWREAYHALHTRAPSARSPVRAALIVPGGVDRSGTRRVIPRVLWLIENLVRHVDLHVIALRQEPAACTYALGGATVHCLPAGVRRSAALAAVLRLQRELRCDVLHALWMHPQGTLGGIVGAISGTPVLLHLTGGDLTALPDIGFGGRLRRRGRFWLRTAVRLADRVTVSSAHLQDAARQLGFDPDVLSFGVALDRWPLRPPQRRAPDTTARILHVGTINRVKDHATLLLALRHLLERGVTFEADLVGEDTLNGEVHAQLRALGLQAHVRMHGWLAHADARALFERAHLLAVSSRHESGPFVMHEAAVAGVPTVGTSVGDLLAWAPDAAVAVPPRDAHALADALAALIADEDRRLAVARAAQQRALVVDASASAARVAEIYEQLLVRRKPVWPRA